MKESEWINTVLDFNKKSWPNNDLFPLNLRDENRTALQEIRKDVSDTSTILIVTGFTSLSFIINFFGREVDFLKVKEARIVLGFYPLINKRKYWDLKRLPDDVKEEWLSKGVSLFHGGGTASIEMIELIKNKQLKFKFSNKLHAKIYVSDASAILGSSNFSKNGLETQTEANIRVVKGENEILNSQYDDICLIARNYYETGIDFTKEILGLLEQLLAVTSWKETLGRAINEILEGNAICSSPELLERINSNRLWPSQKTAIGRALNILHDHQNVLIAEPTGSGKTKVISTLDVILTYWLNETGRRKLTQSLVICPPLVLEKWNREFLKLSFSQPKIISHGTLNNTKRNSYKEALELIRISNLLIIDEAHNYLNNNSIRSGTISKSSADNIILATATPINKKAKDLLRLIELLDVDNLTDEELLVFKELKKIPHIKKQSHLSELEKFIWKFIVRRTKKELTELINKEPDKYTDINNRRCCFPKHNKQIYKVRETNQDRLIAKKINDELSKLNGIINLQEFERYPDDTDEKLSLYFEKRLKAAKALAIYKVQESMRSSKIALIEHIQGTKVAEEFFKMKTAKQRVLGAVKKLEDLRNRGLPRFINISEEQIPFSWLRNREEYQLECENEISVYERVFELAKELSEERENSKIEKIVSLAVKNKKVLVFDHTIITLDYLKLNLDNRKSDIVSFVVTGSSGKSSKNNVLDIFSLSQDDETNEDDHYKNKNIVAFCSDSMSDSVDLQEAEYLVFLDMPSVLRIAEQRIGRLDRLDSPHEEITVYWPKDSSEFALKTDKKLIRTLDVTEALIGANFELPEELLTLETSDYISEFDSYIEKDESWEGMKDAYQPIYDLFQGENALMEEKYVSQLKNIKSVVKCNLSIAINQKSWIFLALKADLENSAKLYFIEEEEEVVYYEFDKVVEKLREKLSEENEWVTEKKWIPRETDEYLNRYFKILQKNERQILPWRKKRALSVAEFILTKIKEKEKKEHKGSRSKSQDYYIRIEVLNEMLKIIEATDTVENFGADINQLADLWIDVFSKRLDQRRAANKNWRKVISLDDFRTDYSDLDLSTEKLKEILRKVEYKEQIWHNVIACIIAIPSSE